MLLSLHALLFFILGTSVFVHPAAVPSPSVGVRLQTLLKGQDFARQSTWIRTRPAKLDKECNDVITFDLPNLPRIGTLRGEPGEISEGKNVEGSDLNEVSMQIEGSWILRPDSTNADHRTSEMIIDPNDQGKPIEIGGPNLETEKWKKTEEHDYPLQGPLSEHVAGLWYRRPPMSDNKNDVIHIFSDGHIEWFQLDAKGQISKIEVHGVQNRLLGTWSRMQHANKDPSDLLDELIFATEDGKLRLSAYGLKLA